MSKWLRIAPVLLATTACAQSLLPDPGDGAGPIVEGPAAAAPAYRHGGERLPLVAGRDLKAKGMVRVDDLLWMSKADADAYGRGWVRLGSTFVRKDVTGTRHRTPTQALTLRTDHLVLRTNLGWADALAVSRRAEAHALRFLLTYGEVFNLRLPKTPLPVVVHARRTGFEDRLRRLTRDPVGWGAFYDPSSATVYLSTEPAARGGLPWTADLRHEMTHQILDLARPAWLRRRAFGKGWFWLWEGIALHAETLGDAPLIDSQALRMARFRTRLQRDQVTPLRRLVALGQGRFTGRHYDQTAALMRYLMDPARPRLRRGILRCVAELMRGQIPPDRLESLLGQRLEDIERELRRSFGV